MMKESPARSQRWDSASCKSGMWHQTKQAESPEAQYEFVSSSEIPSANDFYHQS